MPQLKPPPRRKPVQIGLNEPERRKLERIAESLQVSLGEAARKAIESYKIEDVN
jgi:hypothetical protein